MADELPFDHMKRLDDEFLQWQKSLTPEKLCQELKFLTDNLPKTTHGFYFSAERISGKPGFVIDVRWLEGVARVGLTAGASAPEVLVEQVSQRLADFGFTDQRDLDLIREDVRFTLPPELATIAPAPRR